MDAVAALRTDQVQSEDVTGPWLPVDPAILGGHTCPTFKLLHCVLDDAANQTYNRTITQFPGPCASMSSLVTGKVPS
jgi:hypothetical protein